MVTVVDLPQKRSREGTSRARTGCSTCKARRVKCDEAKPRCRRCATGQRKCEYNLGNIVILPSRNVVTVYVPPSQRQPVLFVNDRGLDFFHRNLAAQLDGQFDSKFWSRLVLQLSHSEPSVRHAVSAITTIHQDVESSLRQPAGYVVANSESHKEWNKAMKSLSARIDAQPNSNLVPLVCCLLFTCIEFLRGNIESSMLHIENGFNILAMLPCHKGATLESTSHFSSRELRDIDDHIIPMFSRLNVLCSLAGRITPRIQASATREDPHEDLADSRRRLFEISDDCIRFIQDARPKATMFQVQVDDFIEQHKLQTRLDAWRHGKDALVRRLQAANRPAKQVALNLLMIQYKVIYIWLRLCTSAEELATDDYHNDFEELVGFAEQIAESRIGSVAPQPLSFDLQTVGPLYYAALKCRDPKLRRRALKLLQFAPRREGLWNSHHAYLTAKRVIELEERNLKGQELPDEASRLHGLHLPDDDSRIYTHGRLPFDFRKFDHSIVPSPTCPGTLEAMFQTKPWGLLGEWHIITEYIEL